MGYYRAGFNVVGVDNRPMPRYPFEFHQADALEYLAEHGQEYDVIHASPPCQRYSKETPTSHKNNHPDLLPEVAEILRVHRKPYIIENVEGARFMLRDPLFLCGSMFGLRIWRHRWFEIYPTPDYLLPPCNHSFIPVLISGTQNRNGIKSEPSVSDRKQAAGIDWMTGKELDQAIPPIYTEFIGRQMLEALKVGR